MSQDSFNRQLLPSQADFFFKTGTATGNQINLHELAEEYLVQNWQELYSQVCPRDYDEDGDAIILMANSLQDIDQSTLNAMLQSAYQIVLGGVV